MNLMQSLSSCRVSSTLVKCVSVCPHCAELYLLVWFEDCLRFFKVRLWKKAFRIC